jgi:uncharacterized protein YxjI
MVGFHFVPTHPTLLVSQKLSLLKQAFELYQEEKEIESEIDPEQDFSLKFFEKKL